MVSSALTMQYNLTADISVEKTMRKMLFVSLGFMLFMCSMVFASDATFDHEQFQPQYDQMDVPAVDYVDSVATDETDQLFCFNGKLSHSIGVYAPNKVSISNSGSVDTVDDSDAIATLQYRIRPTSEGFQVTA